MFRLDPSVRWDDLIDHVVGFLLVMSLCGVTDKQDARRYPRSGLIDKVPFIVIANEVKQSIFRFPRGGARLHPNSTTNTIFKTPY